MNEVLVTGASGFIGRQCLPLLVAKGYDVHALSLRSEPCSIPGVSWHRGNLLQPGCATALMRQLRPQSLLHLAWYAVPGKFWEARENLEWLRASLELLVSFADNGGERLVAAHLGMRSRTVWHYWFPAYDPAFAKIGRASCRERV